MDTADDDDKDTADEEDIDIAEEKTTGGKNGVN